VVRQSHDRVNLKDAVSGTSFVIAGPRMEYQGLFKHRFVFKGGQYPPGVDLEDLSVYLAISCLDGNREYKLGLIRLRNEEEFEGKVLSPGSRVVGFMRGRVQVEGKSLLPLVSGPVPNKRTFSEYLKMKRQEVLSNES
jgi:hypothetical protein